MALIAVLWITSLLALMAAGIGSSSRTAARLAFNHVENAKARLSADAGVQQAVYDLLTEVGARPWQAGGVLHDAVNLNQTEVRILIRDEDGKIDINVSAPELLQGLFAAAGLTEEQAGSLAARLIDYRDKDSDPRPFGAEDADYIAAGRLDGAADRPFRNVVELSDVLGVSDEIYRRVSPHLTIYSDAEGVDLFRASRSVLMALPGMTPEALDTILSVSTTSIENDPLLALPDDLTRPFEDYLLPSRELIFEIKAVGESNGGGRFIRNAIVALDGGRDDLPFTIYAWNRGFF
ncbi:MAG: general secretion pathway protein GspK [Geminicoccaceae bacterium]